MINTPGNPASYPANIRTIEDGDNRNATNLAAATEDLADRTANLNSRLGGAKVLCSLTTDPRDLIGFQSTGSTFIPVKDQGGTSLNMAVSGCHTGDLLDVSVGPLKVSLEASTGTYALGILLVRISHSGTDVDYSFTFDVLSSAPARYVPFSVNIPYVVPSDGTYSVTLWAADNGDGTRSFIIISPGSNHITANASWPNTTPASQVWGRVLRIGSGT